MALYESTLTGFSFPPSLDERKANFRMSFAIRYVDPDDKPAVAAAVVPSADSYWDCDWTRSDTPNYIGPDPKTPPAALAALSAALAPQQQAASPTAATVQSTMFLLVQSSKPDNYGQFDMAKLSSFDRTITIIAGSRLHSLQIAVFDVDREDLGDKILAGLSKVVESGLGYLSKQLPSGLSLPESIQALIAGKIAGPGDRKITTFSYRFTQADNTAAGTPQGWSQSLNADVKMSGKDGNQKSYEGRYTMGLKINTV